MQEAKNLDTPMVLHSEGPEGEKIIVQRRISSFKNKVPSSLLRRFIFLGIMLIYIYIYISDKVSGDLSCEDTSTGTECPVRVPYQSRFLYCACDM